MKTFLLWLLSLFSPHRAAVQPEDVVLRDANNQVTHIPDRYCQTTPNPDGIVIWFYYGESDGMVGASDNNCTSAYKDWLHVRNKFDLDSRI